jgi:hypothetical protein
VESSDVDDDGSDVPGESSDAHDDAISMLYSRGDDSKSESDGDFSSLFTFGDVEQDGFVAVEVQITGES